MVFRKGRTRECLTLFEVAGRNLIPCRSYYGWLRLTLGGRCSLSLIHTQSFPSSCKRFANGGSIEMEGDREANSLTTGLRENHIKAVLRSASFITAIRSREAETTFTCSDEWKPGSWMV
nr:hypothetical protein Iba_chr07bCG9010 [Ipomoea batatas]